jgi:transposase
LYDILHGMENNAPKTDARRLTHTQLTELRKRAVAAVHNGESPATVARVFGTTDAAVYGWLALYREGGWHNLNAKKRGGRPTKLTTKHMRWIYKTVTQGDPRQLKFEFALWSANLLRAAIARKFGIKLGKTSVCRLLHQLGLTPQRPLWRAYQRDPEAVRKSLAEAFPAINKAAKRAKAEIWFGDEAGVRSDSHSGTTWAPKGCTPVISTTGARFGLNLISAVSNKGAMRFMCVGGRVNAGVFITFLKRLLVGAEHPVWLVVDGHATHKAAAVSAFAASAGGMLKIFFLPPYSPDLNPDELVWNHLKNHGTGSKQISGPDQLKELVTSHLRSLQKQTGKIVSFFHAPSVKYAA